MHIASRPGKLWLIPIAAIGLGCSSTGGMGRTALDPSIRTIAAIGDRPIGVVAGVPAPSTVGDLDGPRTRRQMEGSVSGRVVDGRGRPVADARVRVADGGLSAGRLVEATTDRAGGFTLHGLRPDSRYTLIAESTSRGGLVTGRADVRSPETGIEIALQAPDEPLDRRRADEPSSSRKVSKRRAIDDEADEAPAQKSKANKEDLPESSDVEDIDDLASTVSPRSRTGVAKLSGWRKGRDPIDDRTVASSAVDDREARRASAEADEPAPTRARSRSQPPPEVDEESDENPLPPAIEPKASRKKDVGAGQDRDPDRSAERPKPPPRVSQVKPKGPGQTPGALALADDPPKDVDRPPAIPPAPDRPGGEKTSPEADPFGPSRPKLRTTWADLATSWDAASAEPSSSGREPIPRVDRAMPDADRRQASSPSSARERAWFGSGRDSIEACRYDARLLRIEDFRLPDVDGRKVTLRDFDADFILLDFWGTWCRPCMNSIPHLVELQERYGARTLAVVGIACEDGPASASAAHVADVAERLGINYSVLVSSKDGSSPVQEALHIQAYPTMVLIDRQGRIVWRETGATSTTLARLDRALDSGLRAAKDERTRR